MKIEKRQDPRTLIKIKIDYQADGAYLYDYSVDMSEGGIFIKTEKPLKVGERMTLRFILPEFLEEIEAKGKVTWVNPATSKDVTPGMGVKFVKLSAKKSELIQKVIKKIEGGKGIPSIEE